ncbi:flagellar protein FhlB [Microbulbifer sp. SH-1]|uniref:EscU/YscU/HrcU family type III secretion system export apparatus switch protein n=1 Tax=Microbulbifer sp. SH-1 TaxID=2681547 RepID=UPI00140CAF33|nr:EscU/YscU/HrcU family type III secretion system export apparatus switch protein [Microbulbifer sp. SH-1]QIL89879.1 flagellar protein FhlB [Microbulbifer sp. SH-1]
MTKRSGNQGPNQPRRRAVAIGQNGHDDVAKILAAGYGEVAERIIESAREHEIFVHDAPALVSLLMQLNLDQKIPPKLYAVIAEILIWSRNFETEKLKKEPIE